MFSFLKSVLYDLFTHQTMTSFFFQWHHWNILFLDYKTLICCTGIQKSICDLLDIYFNGLSVFNLSSPHLFNWNLHKRSQTSRMGEKCFFLCPVAWHLSDTDVCVCIDVRCVSVFCFFFWCVLNFQCWTTCTVLFLEMYNTRGSH